MQLAGLQKGSDQAKVHGNAAKLEWKFAPVIFVVSDGIVTKELFEYFCKLDGFKPKKGNSLSGFAPDWIGQFYARSQWQENIPSTKLVSILPPDFVKASYAGLHDLDLDLAVNKVFKNIHV